MSDTPKTDSMIQPFDAKDCVTGEPIQFVHVDDCRQLERELNEAKADCGNPQCKQVHLLLNAQLEALELPVVPCPSFSKAAAIAATIEEIKKQRDQWRECAQWLAKELYHRVGGPRGDLSHNKALTRFDELEKDSTPATTAEWMKELRDGEAMTVEEARQKRICRICHGPDDAPFTYNYGKEYAHTKCLELEKGGQ